MSDAAVEILIKTSAELAGAKAAADSLERSIGAAKALGKEYGAMAEQLERARKAIDAYETFSPAGPSGGKKDLAGIAGWDAAAVADYHKRAREALKPIPPLIEEQTSAWQRARAALAENIPGFSRLNSVVTQLGSGLVGGLVAGLGLVTSGLLLAKKALTEFAGAQTEVYKLDAALAQTGQLTDQYREHLQHLAKSIASDLKMQDEEWVAVIARLTQFGANAGNIEQVTKAVENLAGMLHGNVQEAAMLVSKALQGNYAMFQRYGISVKDAATQTEKFNQLCLDLAAHGAGQLKAVSEGLEGQWRGFKIVVTDLSKAFGGLISSTGAVQYVLYGLTESFKWLEEKIGGVIPRLGSLRNAQQTTVQTVEQAAEAEKHHAAAIEATTTAAKRAADALADELKIIQAKKAQEDMAADAGMAKEIAGVKFLQERGALSPAQATVKEANIRQKYEEQKTQREIQSKQAEASAQDATIANVIAQMDKFHQIQTTKQTEGDALKKYEEAKSKAASASKNATLAQSDYAAQVKNLNETVQGWGLSGSDLRTESNAEVVAHAKALKAQQDAAAANREAESLRPSWFRPGMSSEGSFKTAAAAKAALEKDFSGNADKIASSAVSRDIALSDARNLSNVQRTRASTASIDLATTLARLATDEKGQAKPIADAAASLGVSLKEKHNETMGAFRDLRIIVDAQREALRALRGQTNSRASNSRND